MFHWIVFWQMCLNITYLTRWCFRGDQNLQRSHIILEMDTFFLFKRRDWILNYDRIVLRCVFLSIANRRCIHISRVTSQYTFFARPDWQMQIVDRYISAEWSLHNWEFVMFCTKIFLISDMTYIFCNQSWTILCLVAKRFYVTSDVYFVHCVRILGRAWVCSIINDIAI